MVEKDDNGYTDITRRKTITVLGVSALSLGNGLVGPVSGEKENSKSVTDFDPKNRKEVIQFIEAHDESNAPDELEDKLNQDQEEAVIDVLLNPDWEMTTELQEMYGIMSEDDYESMESIHTARATIAGNVRYELEQLIKWEFDGESWRNASTDQDGYGKSFTTYDGEASSQIRNETSERFDARERAQFSLNVGFTVRNVTAEILQRCWNNGNAELINESTPL
ncbi:hypothetical protein [Natrinema salaciae]|uniref:Uncharacterized protein n=1 Tax=Natrinema salaciae TaxID=1186196 RepID=A0A1H9J7N6_9EURY|nr:hypothetical protein [Natrinema salaciae]SEQ82813.1 hypothetical protein SAMN04489841_2460 [Natrinema salaciae]